MYFIFLNLEWGIQTLHLIIGHFEFSKTNLRFLENLMIINEQNETLKVLKILKIFSKCRVRKIYFKIPKKGRLKGKPWLFQDSHHLSKRAIAF